ncbi:MAG TPA: L,D-transpeptidase [Anaerolineaceae bacterium]|nr:L,D-transpeptidase [Anaerolineaceae bacterium]
MSSLAFRPYFPPGDDFPSGDIARVATTSVSVYKEPDDESPIVTQRYRDELVNVYAEVISEKGPAYNPLWYRVWRGYIHSAHMQKVQVKLNPVASSIPEGGRLGEITVPFTQSLRFAKPNTWSDNCYRLYYGSNHWIIGIDEGPDGDPWYRVHDELLEIAYHVPAVHMRIFRPEEFSPISPNVPWEKKKVEVSISKQELIAYEDGNVVLQTKISSGIPSLLPSPNGIPTATPTGDFNIMSKMPSKHMGDGHITNDLEAYELPGVPWVSFFTEDGVAFHGTYWHNNFGVQMSHGCVNMRTEEAQWLYRWLLPAAESGDWEKRGYGTRVLIT